MVTFYISVLSVSVDISIDVKQYAITKMFSRGYDNI